MKQLFLLQTILFFVAMNIKAQNPYYDAVWLRQHLSDKVFISEKFTNQQDSLKTIDGKLEQIVTSFEANNNPHKQDSINKYQHLRQDINSQLNNIIKAKDDSLFNLLKKYFPEIETSSTSDEVTTLIKKNPFLDSFTMKGTLREGGISFRSLKLSNVIQSIGGLDVTKYANAIADIMIERAKQELTVAFFDRFKKFAKDNPEFQILFPKTTDNLSNLISFTYPQMLPALRDGFFEDLKQITYHLDDVLDLPRYQSLLQNFPEVKIAIRSIRIVHEIETGASNAADIIKEFAKFPEWKNSPPPKIQSVGSCLNIASLFSESIRNDSTKSHTNDVWVSAKELKELFYDETFFNIYLGLIYQQSVNDKIVYIAKDGTSKNFETILAAQKNNIFLFQNKLKEFFDLTGNVNTTFQSLQNKIQNKESPSNDDIYNYISTSINVVEYSFSIVKIFHEKPIADDYLALIKKSNSLYKDIYTKAFSQAVSDAFDIFSGLNNLINSQIDFDKIKNDDAVKSFSGEAKNDIEILASSDKKFDKVKSNVDNAVASAISDKTIQTLVEHYSLKGLFNFINKVKPYALFMANMIEAKNDGEVKAALENVILPVGSSSVKKFTLCNISVQTYLGAYVSFAGKNNISGSWSDNFGVIAPIGISFTPGFLSFGNGGSISPFVSLFDLAAIVDYKLQKEPDLNSTDPNATVIKKDYEVKLGQIFSPGAYLVYGFPWKLPLSLGAGVQYGPGLSKISSDNQAVVNNPSWRGNFFLAVDIPFFNLKNKIKHQ